MSFTEPCWAQEAANRAHARLRHDYHVDMIEKSLAVIVLIVCLVMMGRLLIGQRLRYRFDFAVLRAVHSLRGVMSARRNRASRKDAARAAEEAIRRAKEGGSWEGNVYKPKSFRRPRKPH